VTVTVSLLFQNPEVGKRPTPATCTKKRSLYSNSFCSQKKEEHFACLITKAAPFVYIIQAFYIQVRKLVN
jgi:hypothetical protein